MKITRFLVSLLLLCALPAMAMTDEQVINYIKTQAASGKSQNQIGKELLAKGVTPEQVKRIKARYEKEQSGEAIEGAGPKVAAGSNKLRSGGGTAAQSRNGGGRTDFEVELVEYEETDPSGTERSVAATARNIYGHEVFNSRALSFEPNSNIATPQNYRLGPGDEIVIDIWGNSEDHLREVISPEGSIMISQLGPVYLNGMTVADANKHVKNIFARKYAGIGSDQTDINVTLGNVRSIQVDIMGEVRTPGSYRLSPFSNVFHALYLAGGINDIGTMRNIQVLRNGKRISNVDVYDFLFKGKDTGNIRLQEGDVIIVPPFEELVSIEGNVKRPMYYEMKPTESLSTLIEYAGGFSSDAYSDVVRLQRQNGIENELYTIQKNSFPSYMLTDGDVVTVGTVKDRYSNKVEIKGSVNRPGLYALSDDIRTLRGLISKADGLAEEAYMDRAFLYREKPDRSLEVIAINLGDLMNGSMADIALQKNDIFEIMDINDIVERGGYSIQGLVKFPGSYPYAEGTTLEDLILRAGGLREGASTVNIEVSRRIIDEEANVETTQIAELFTFHLENGLILDGKKEFELKPYDLVQVRKSPTYEAQRQVSVDGEILFPGGYVLQSRNERISDVVKRAGGLLTSAYTKGAYLERNMTADQIAARDETIRLARMNAHGEDSISMAKVQLSTRYKIGIDLEKALENPGSDFDFVLQPGDLLFVPEMQSTVNISGDVLYPNTVLYVPGKKYKYYVEQAGGFGERARKNKAFVVYMNGTVAKCKNSTPIEPGCRIIIPSKPDSKPFDWAKVLSISTSLGSLATMAAAIATIAK
ncbi:MAG: SLBB domain-containing protein [Muribaculum sp.]|nr:SLBB domain-containing protein [Muribaculum sp.]